MRNKKISLTFCQGMLYTEEDVDYMLKEYGDVVQAYNQALETKSEKDLYVLFSRVDLARRGKSIGILNANLDEFKNGKELCDKVQELLDESGRELND